MTAGILLHHDYVSLYLWAALTLLICVAPIGMLFGTRVIEALSRSRAPQARSFPVQTQRRIGEILLRQGLLTSEQLRSLLDLQATRATTGEPWRRLGDLAVELGYVSPTRLRAAVALDARSRPDTTAARHAA
jgi:cellulose synthase (UDP-forming)